MHASALDRRRPAELGLLLLAVGLSLGAHAALATSVAQIPAKVDEKPVWVEMVVTVNEPPPPPPEPEPEPEPEVEPPEPPPPPPEPVAFKETTPEPPPPEPPPDRKPVRRITQGLSSDSFTEGPGTGLAVRRGTTLATAATEKPLAADEEDGFATLPYTSVTTRPKVGRNPPIVVPQAVIDAQVQGRVGLELTVDATGAVIDAVVVSPLHPAADAACVEHARTNTRWKPGLRDGEALAVRGVPYTCRFEMATH